MEIGKYLNMKMKPLFYISFYILYALLMICCNEERGYKYVSIQKVDTTFLDENVINFIHQYMEQNSQYHIFTLLTDYEYNWRNNCKRKPALFIIGPTTEGMFCGGEGTLSQYPSIYVEIPNHLIFIQSSFDELNNVDSIAYNKLLSSTKYHVKERKKECNPFIDFLSKATAFSLNEDGITILSNKADTLIFKKRIIFTPPR